MALLKVWYAVFCLFPTLSTAIHHGTRSHEGDWSDGDWRDSGGQPQSRHRFCTPCPFKLSPGPNPVKRQLTTALGSAASRVVSGNFPQPTPPYPHSTASITSSTETSFEPNPTGTNSNSQREQTEVSDETLTSDYHIADPNPDTLEPTFDDGYPEYCQDPVVQIRGARCSPASEASSSSAIGSDETVDAYYPTESTASESTATRATVTPSLTIPSSTTHLDHADTNKDINVVTVTKTLQDSSTETITKTISSHRAASTASNANASAAEPNSEEEQDNNNNNNNNSLAAAAIIVPVILTALVALLMMACVVRRCMPRLWASINRVLPLENFWRGAVALWARAKMGRARNREVRGGRRLTGDGWGRGAQRAGASGGWGEGQSGSGRRGGPKQGEQGWARRWREGQEEKLEQVRARWAREERWGLRAMSGGSSGSVVLGERPQGRRLRGAGGAGGVLDWRAVRAEDLRRMREEELRRVRGEKDAAGMGV